MGTAGPVWRHGAVARARTVAADLRLIDIAVAGILAPFRQGDRAAVALPSGGPALAWFPCLPGPPGHVRIAVEHDAGRATGFIWRLVEGAPLRLKLARRLAGPCRELFEGAAANDNAASGRGRRSATPPRPVPGTGRRSRAGARPRR